MTKYYNSWSSKQPGLVEDVPTHGRGVGTRWSLRSFPTLTILWFYVNYAILASKNKTPELL